VPPRRRRWQESSRRRPGHSYRPPRCAGTPSIINSGFAHYSRHLISDRVPLEAYPKGHAPSLVGGGRCREEELLKASGGRLRRAVPPAGHLLRAIFCRPSSASDLLRAIFCERSSAGHLLRAIFCGPSSASDLLRVEERRRHIKKLLQYSRSVNFHRKVLGQLALLMCNSNTPSFLAL